MFHIFFNIFSLPCLSFFLSEETIQYLMVWVNNLPRSSSNNNNTENLLQTEGKVDWKHTYLEDKLQTLREDISKLAGYLGATVQQ